MSDRASFELWAPPHVPWSRWAKPTLFAHATAATDPGDAPPPRTPRSAELVWPERIPPRTALVLDMPAATSIEAGLALIDRGYWPVPLFNATPGTRPILDADPILRSLRATAPALRSRGDASAMPCFLLDSGRCPPGVKPTPGQYDNRWIVFPQDFPSGTMLRAHSIEQAMIVLEGGHGPDIPTDLAHVAFGWQRDGLRILTYAPARQSRPEAAQIARPGGFGSSWRRILTFVGLHRNGAGGFGSRIPEQSSGSGYA